MWLQPRLKGVGVEITWHFQALFEGVTPRLQLHALMVAVITAS